MFSKSTTKLIETSINHYQRKGLVLMNNDAKCCIVSADGGRSGCCPLMYIGGLGGVMCLVCMLDTLGNNREEGCETGDLR